MNKSFRQYLMESVKTYKYKIKIAGQPPKNFVEMFCYNLQKFDPISISNPKTTPIQKDPYGFPGLKDQPITIIDVEFKYPAIEPFVKQVARLLNYDENLVRMIQSDYDDSIDQEDGEYSNQPSPLILADYEEIPGAKQASKDYGNSYLNNIKQQTQPDKIQMPYAGEKTKDAFDPFKPYVATDKDSPMTKVVLGPKPATNAIASRKG
jgi:hypothetical protein